MSKIFCISDIHGHLTELEEALARIKGEAVEDGRLILLGDYMDNGPDSGGVLRRLFELQKAYGSERIIVLRGNHEEEFLNWLNAYAGSGTSQPDEYGLTPWSGWLDVDTDFQTLRTLITSTQWDFFRQVMPTLSEDTLNLTAAKMVLENNRELIGWLRALPYFYETDKQIFVHAGIDEEAGEFWPWATPESSFVGKFPVSKGPFYKDIIAGHIGTYSISGDPGFHDIYWDGANHYYIDGTVYVSGCLPVLMYDEETGKYTSLSDVIRSR